ncbi:MULTISPECIES: polysaccharide lyase 6 family protein [unclassified Cellulophaga]|uniref:polysaccharide lyase 6 family protein n=1 Tax=unclassified Cellulophaga TaxID=2634405 RepID=UPI0026E1C5F6|nr:MULTISPECIES: polysaccharide lyase 6 family protein [unclassified Cellulophaga]MDO6491977.1 polysaccharide lyase 6 family protein [Cellulophaga sp. 2_MG-2023]MDO6495863.1 polysaccharide lyase 6 family protein [Cellulophaga sp. 3_MG-2023]
MQKHTLYIAFIVLFSIISCTEKKNTISNVEQFNSAVKKAQPGDVLTLANGVWNNTELLFAAKGTAEKPITLTVEEKGKVTLEGQSNLRISGEHLIIKGLVFKNGYTPTNEVISFKEDSKTLANNVRLTQCVIDNFSNPERHEPDTWVAIYGKNNRIDHNHLSGKKNRGVTMTVRLNTKESQENDHKIDHNYFGPRQNLGSNGGETLRIGTSHFSRTNSNTIVENNYFDRCNGEHEIISNKSCQNTYKSNVFYECTGTLTMRHGNRTMVDGNIFIGNNKPSTGGIRVINGEQTVVNNYGIGLTGYRFRGAFVIMNGIYNSPINRYDQAKDAVIKNNTFVNSNHIQLCAGSDAERSAPPENCVMENNIFYNENKDNIFTVYDDISGIAFKNNIISKNIKPISETGFEAKEISWNKNADGLLVPANTNLNTGATLPAAILKKENTGVNWYSKEDTTVAFGSGQTIKVKAGLNTLFEAVNNSSAGDVLELSANEPYTLSKTIAINHPLSFVSNSTEKPTILFEKKTLFEIKNGGSLNLKGINFDGENAPDRTGNSVITTSKYSMNKNYKLFIDNCDFVNLDVNHSFDAVMVYKNTFADTISIKNSKFNTISGNVLALDKETEDIGIYNAEYVILKNNSFSNVNGAVLSLHRGGKDESTFGPFLELDHNTFDAIGYGKRNKYNAAINLYGVQVNTITNNIFNKTKSLKMHLVVGEPIVNILNNNFYKSEGLEITGDQKYNVENLWTLDPSFKEGSYALTTNSDLASKATDGKNLGLIINN